LNRLLYAALAVSLAASSAATAQSDPPSDRIASHREVPNPEPFVQNFVDHELSEHPSDDDGRSNLGRAERAAETLIAQHVDAERARLAPDAPQLTPDPDLTDIARDHSEAMAHGAPFSHEDENGRFVAADRVHERFGPYGAIGENILEIYGSRDFDAAAFAERAVSGWMTSLGHRANILSPDYRSSGIGVSVNGAYAYATQVFRGPPKGAAIRPPS
jgi:uncharacterized protein YkwD